MDAASAGESFRSLLLRHRGRTGLIQRDLAARAGISVRSFQEWEAFRSQLLSACKPWLKRS